MIPAIPNHCDSAKPNGQNLAEMALVLPLLLFLLMGVIDFARAFHSLIVVENAARQGARYAASHPADIAGAQAAASTEASDANIPILAPEVDVTGSAGSGTVVVRVTTRMDVFLDLMGVGPITIVGHAEMALLGSPGGT